MEENILNNLLADEMNLPHHRSTIPYRFIVFIQFVLFCGMGYSFSFLNNNNLLFTLLGFIISLMGFIFAKIWRECNLSKRDMEILASRCCMLFWGTILLIFSIYTFMGYTNESVLQYVSIAIGVAIVGRQLYRKLRYIINLKYRNAITSLYQLQQLCQKERQISLKEVNQTLSYCYIYLKSERGVPTDELAKQLYNFKFHLMQVCQTLDMETIQIDSSYIKEFLQEVSQFAIQREENCEHLISHLVDIIICFTEQVVSGVTIQSPSYREEFVSSTLIGLIIEDKRRAVVYRIKQKRRRPTILLITFLTLFFIIGLFSAIILDGEDFSVLYHTILPIGFATIAGWAYFRIEEFVRYQNNLN